MSHTTPLITEVCSFVQARNLLKRGNEEVPLELLNNIGLLHFEKGEFEVRTHSCILLQIDTLWQWLAQVSCFWWAAMSCVFQLAGEAFREALGEGIWCNFFYAEGESVSNMAQTDAYGEAPSHEEQLSPSRRVRDNLINSTRYPVDASSIILQYKDLQLFHRLEEQGLSVELPWNKVSILFNLARVLEQLHNTESASILYRLIIFKVSTFPSHCSY